MKSNTDVKDLKDPIHFIEKMKEMTKDGISWKERIKEIDVLRDCMHSSIEWLKEFNNAQNKGLSVLTDVLSQMQTNPEAIQACFRCLRVFGNTEYGLSELIASPDTLGQVANTLSKVQHSQNLLLTLEILVTIAFYSEQGHEAVLAALMNAARPTNETRFQPLVRALRSLALKDDKEEENSPVLLMLAFVNVLVNPNFRDEDSSLPLYYRLHLRRELIGAGLLEAYSELDRKSPRNVAAAEIVQLFFVEIDLEEEDSSASVETQLRAFADHEEMLRLTRRALAGTECEQLFTSIFGSLFMVRNNERRTDLYRFLDQIVTDIVLQQTDNDSDFSPYSALRKIEERQTTGSSSNLNKYKLEVDDLKCKIEKLSAELEMYKVKAENNHDSEPTYLAELSNIPASPMMPLNMTDRTPEASGDSSHPQDPSLGKPEQRSFVCMYAILALVVLLASILVIRFFSRTFDR